MKTRLYTLLLALLVVSCAKDNDPYIVNNTLQISQESLNQRARAGEKLQFPIRLYKYGNNADEPNDLTVYVRVKKGGGTVTQSKPVFYQGAASFEWTLGTQSNLQELEIRLLRSNDTLPHKLSVKANTFGLNPVDTSYVAPDVNFFRLFTDKYSGKTYMFSQGWFIQGEKHYNWDRFYNFPAGNTPGTETSIDGKSNMATVYGDRVRVFNLVNQSPQVESRPFGANATIFVRYDNTGVLWASSANGRLANTTDLGLNWTYAVQGLKNGDFLGTIYRDSEGSLYYQTRNFRLVKSVDNGLTWTEILAKAQNLYLTDKDEIVVLDSDAAYRILISKDGGKTFDEAFKWGASSLWAYQFDNFVEYGEYVYFLITGHGIFRTTDFATFEPFFPNQQIDKFNIDHNGWLIASTTTRTFYMRAD